MGLRIQAKVAIAVLATALLPGCDDLLEPSGYNERIRANFMAECTANGGPIPDPEAYCTCTYDNVVKTIPFDEFLEMDRAMSENRATSEQYARLLEAAGSCLEGIM